MKEKSKKIISIAIVLFMVLNYFVPVINYAEDNTNEGIKQQTEVEEIGREYEIKETEEWDISKNGDKSVIAKWNLEDKSITISGKGNMKDWNYSFSEKDWHRKYKRVIEKVVINNGITNIGNFAFYGCSSIEEITIPNSVRSIEWQAFGGCISLKEITIPSIVTSIEEDTFEGCSSLKEIKVSSENNNYTSIDGVLYNKNKTTIIAYPANKPGEKYSILTGVTSIGEYAFCGCSSLKEIIIPSSVTRIGYDAFNGCSNLEEIIIPSGVTSIEGYTFKECSSLKEITIPDSVTSIKNYAFEGCSSLEEITIPNSVTSIGMYAFNGCSCLRNITIPSNVTSIGENAFYGVRYIICKTNSYAHKYAEDNEICYKLLDNIVSQYSDSFEIKETEEWDISAKQDKSVIAKWNWGDKSISISGKGNMKDWNYNYSEEDWHGKYRNVIEKVIINNGITNIGKIAFYRCSSIEEITIPDSVTSIKNYAFEGCSSIEEITIPSSVTSIGSSAFERCSSLEEIKVSSENKNYTSVEGVVYNKDKTNIIKYPANKSGEKYVILSSVTSIERNAFYGCSSLKEITITSSVTSIGR